jgi:hypothetical protein
METVQDLWSKHSYWLIPLAWMVLSAILNKMFRKKSPEAWVEYSKKNPRMAAVIRLCSSLGIDLSKALLAFKRFVDGKASQPKPPALEVADKVIDAVVDGVAPEDEEDEGEDDEEDGEEAKDEKDDSDKDDSEDDKEKDK